MPNPPRQIDPSGEYRPPEALREPWIFEDQIAHNRRVTALLMIGFVLVLSVFVWAVGYLLGSGQSAYIYAAIAMAISIGMSWYSYYHSDQLVLGMSQARPATKQEHPHLINTLEGLALAAGMRTVPRAYIIEDTAPNAFATGRDPEHAAVAVTTGLLDKLGRYQLEGVLAHELSHVANRDILVATVSAVLVGTIVLIADGTSRALVFGGRRRRSNDQGGGNVILLVVALVAVIIGPIIAQLMRLAIS
jgi:heat shock protein HtpX